jgi:hypothetical protein
LLRRRHHVNARFVTPRADPTTCGPRYRSQARPAAAHILRCSSPSKPCQTGPRSLSMLGSRVWRVSAVPGIRLRRHILPKSDTARLKSASSIALSIRTADYCASRPRTEFPFRVPLPLLATETAPALGSPGRVAGVA